MKKITKTQDCHVLFQMAGGRKAGCGAAALTKAVLDGAGDLSGRVVQLGTSTVVEIVDLDPNAQREDIMSALVSAVESCDPEDAVALKAQVSLTGLWRVKSGTQIATARIPQAAAKLTSLRVGWTIAKVRPRRPDPVRCFKCHGFGHSSSGCTGPGMTGTCRRCGGRGHMEKSCVESAKCVACDRLSREYAPHRTGSGGCLARLEGFAKAVAGPKSQQ